MLSAILAAAKTVQANSGCCLFERTCRALASSTVSTSSFTVHKADHSLDSSAAYLQPLPGRSSDPQPPHSNTTPLSNQPEVPNVLTCAAALHTGLQTGHAYMQTQGSPHSCAVIGYQQPLFRTAWQTRQSGSGNLRLLCSTIDTDQGALHPQQQPRQSMPAAASLEPQEEDKEEEPMRTKQRRSELSAANVKEQVSAADEEAFNKGPTSSQKRELNHYGRRFENSSGSSNEDSDEDAGEVGARDLDESEAEYTDLDESDEVDYTDSDVEDNVTYYAEGDGEEGEEEAADVDEEEALPLLGYLEGHLSKQLGQHVTIRPFTVQHPAQSATFLADEVAMLFENRVKWRAIKLWLRKDVAAKPYVKGLRVAVSGRLGGKGKRANQARTETVKFGQTSLSVFANRVDFAAVPAYTASGLMGVKVWINYGR